MSGAFTSQGHNLIGDGTGGTGFTNGVNGDIVGTSVNPIDPKLGPLKNNGGRTKTHALLAGSPAIDAGDNAGVPATDQRGRLPAQEGRQLQRHRDRGHRRVRAVVPRLGSEVL